MCAIPVGEEHLGAEPHHASLLSCTHYELHALAPGAEIL
jgi:hypothetical protein